MIDFDTALGEQLLDVAVERPKRRYQRTATTITSGGNRKPEKADRAAGAEPGEWRDLMPGVSLLQGGHSERNSADGALSLLMQPGTGL